MTRSAWLALFGAIAVLLVAAIVLRPDKAPSVGRDAPTARVGEEPSPAPVKRGVGGAEDAEPGDEEAGDGEPGEGEELAAVPDAPPSDGGAALGLPPVDTGPQEDLCTALEQTRKRLRTAENMLEKIPAENAKSVGAQKLRIVRDRLRKLSARYARRAAARGECG